MNTIDSDGTFVCPKCRGEIPIDQRKKRALIRHGCAVCGAAITAEVFDRGPNGSSVESRSV